MRLRSGVAAACAVFVVVHLATGAVAAAADVPDLGGLVRKAEVSSERHAVNLVGGWSGNQTSRPAPGGAGTGPNIEHEERFARACAGPDSERMSPGDATCFGFGAPVCDETETPRAPRWTRSRVLPSGAWSEWSLQDYGACVGPGAPVPVLTAEDFRRLPLPAPTLHVQPDGDWVLVNVETIVYTDPTPVTLTTDLLGYEVTVEATPQEFTYDWGDGHSTTTRDAGRPYPALDVVHRYERPGRVAITLTTQWSGRYRVAGDPQWRDVTGTAQTSVAGPALDVEERTSRLVSGTCRQQPDAPGCEGTDASSARG